MLLWYRLPKISQLSLLLNDRAAFDIVNAVIDMPWGIQRTCVGYFAMSLKCCEC